jgi:hypothetical protein
MEGQPFCLANQQGISPTWKIVTPPATESTQPHLRIATRLDWQRRKGSVRRPMSILFEAGNPLISHRSSSLHPNAGVAQEHSENSFVPTMGENVDGLTPCSPLSPFLVYASARFDAKILKPFPRSCALAG